MNESYYEPSKNIPVFAEYDVVVCGGGIAGVSAACSAARNGARTLLVERLEILGGLGTAGGVGNFCFGDDTLPYGQGKVFDDIYAGLKFYKAIGAENGWHIKNLHPFYNHTFDHNILSIVLQELAEHDGVDLLFATDVIGAEVVNDTIKSVMLHNRSLSQKVMAKQFIDATGDGILSRHAGANVLPPDAKHQQSIPPSHMIFVQKSAIPAIQPVRDDAENNLPMRYSVWDEPERIGLKIFWPGGDFDTSTGQGYSDAGRAFRRRIPEIVRDFQQKEAGKDTVFAYSAPMFGLRDSLRIVGDYVLTEDDLKNGKRFDDAVAYGCFPLDSSLLEKKSLPPYQIPYRSLLVKEIKNLLVAGRCFSASRIALSSTRIMVTCCQMGQAAGIAAAMASKAEYTLRSIDPADIRQSILNDAPDDKMLEERIMP
ncbi:MAG: FAD-dependent oxidoreductase [bacterium]